MKNQITPKILVKSRESLVASANAAPRKCKACETPLVRKPGEPPSRWKTRTVCDERCRLVVMCKRVRELDSQRIELKCPCGTKITRSSRLRSSTVPRCPACVNAFRLANAAKKRVTQREQARRYRILIAVGPYKTWQELLGALKMRNPYLLERRSEELEGESHGKVA